MVLSMEGRIFLWNFKSGHAWVVPSKSGTFGSRGGVNLVRICYPYGRALQAKGCWGRHDPHAF